MQKQHLIISKSEFSKVDFNQLIETSIESHVLSYSGDKVIIKWIGETPSFIENLDFKDGPYNQEQIIEILASEEWNGLI